MAIYNPSNNIPLSKPMGPVDFSVDGRELLQDTVNYTRRPYVSPAEVLSNVPIQFRYTGLRVIVNNGGTLNSNGTITGGVNDVYWFKNGTSNASLVKYEAPGKAGIPNWESKSYEAGSQVIYNSTIWESNSGTLQSDIPGVSSKWFEAVATPNVDFAPEYANTVFDIYKS